MIMKNNLKRVVITGGAGFIGSNLVKKFQYKKNVGRNILLKYYENDSSFVCDTFLLVDVKNEGIMLRKSKKDYFIVFENIKSAKIKVSID